jgi:hypothetical protein
MKRFTDTEKWVKDKWYGDLEPRDKLFWLYILDNCDNVGVWEENMRVANLLIGYEYSLDTLLEVFGNRLHKFDDGRKFWIRGFVQFQHADMNEESKSKAVQSYVSLLKKHRLWNEYTKGIDTLQGKGKGKGSGKGKGTGIDYPPEFEEWWVVYKKGNKSKALEFWKKQKVSLVEILQPSKDYIAYCKSIDRTMLDGQGFINQRTFETTWTHSAQGTSPLGSQDKPRAI